MTRHQLILVIAAAADADPRTVKKHLDGKKARGSVGERIDREVQTRTVEVSAYVNTPRG